MMFTSAELLAIIAGIVTIVTALSVGIVNVVTALRTTAKLDSSLAKTDGLVNQVKEVHTLTNSNLSAVKAELATAAAKITALMEIVQDLKSERSKTATLAALHMTAPAPAAALGTTLATDATLDKIEIHTKETASNTAKTDAAVADLTKDKS